MLIWTTLWMGHCQIWVQAWAKRTINKGLTQKRSQLTLITLTDFCCEHSDVVTMDTPTEMSSCTAKHVWTVQASSAAGHWLSHVSTSAYQRSSATLTCSPDLCGYVHNNATTKHPCTQACSNELSTVYCGSTGQPEVPKSAISLNQQAPNVGFGTQEQLSLFDCNFHDADRTRFARQRTLGTKENLLLYGPQIFLFSIIPLLAIRSPDRGRLIAGLGYNKPLAGTENCYYKILHEYIKCSKQDACIFSWTTYTPAADLTKAARSWSADQILYWSPAPRIGMKD